MLSFFFSLGALAKWILSGFEGHYSEYRKGTLVEFIIGFAFYIILMGILFFIIDMIGWVDF